VFDYEATHSIAFASPRAAQKAKVAELLTDNFADFAGLEAGFSVSPP